MVESEMENDRSDHRDYESQHDGDKPGDSTFGLPGRLGDAEGVDERVGQKEQRTHGDWILDVN